MFIRFLLAFTILLSGCATTPAANPNNRIIETDEISARENLTDRERRQLALSTPYILEMLPEFEGYVFETDQTNVGDDMMFCGDFGMNMDVDHNEIVTGAIAKKESEAAGAGDVIAAGTSTAAAVGLGAAVLAIAILGPFAGALGTSSTALAGSAFSAAASATISQIGPAIVLGAVLAESEKASIDGQVKADNAVRAFVLKSAIIRCLTSKGYNFDIYGGLVMADKANIEFVEYGDAVNLLETYGDLAIAEYQVIANDIDAYETYSDGSYYDMSDYEKNSLKLYLEYLKSENQPLRIMQKEVALKRNETLDQDSLIYWDSYSKRFVFLEQNKLAVVTDNS